MTRKRLRNSFDMDKIRTRVKAKVRKKHGKIIKKSLINRVWKDYCEIVVIGGLVRDGKVEVDKDMSIEIVGSSITSSKYLKRYSEGKGKVDVLSKMRPDVIYKIKLTERSYKGGKVIFHPSKKLKDKVKDALRNTSTYYRIEK